MSDRLTPEREAEIAARAEAATPGPWCTDSWEIYQGTEYVAGAEWIGETCRGRVEGLAQDRADAAFVAAARTDVPALLAELAAVRAERDQAQARVADLEAQRAALAVRLRAGQRWQPGRVPPLVTQDYVSQDDLRAMFDIPLVAPWDDPAEDPCHTCGCPKRFDRHADGCPKAVAR